MKWIKYAVGLVIALSVIPLVVVTVNNLEATRLKTVEFEVENYNDNDNIIVFSESIFEDIHALATYVTNEYDEDVVDNLITVTLNGNKMMGAVLTLSEGYYYGDDSANDWKSLYDYTAEPEGYPPTIGDKWTMTFEVSIMPPLVKLFIGFVPLIFIGGILLFMLNKRKKEVF